MAPRSLFFAVADAIASSSVMTGQAIDRPALPTPPLVAPSADPLPGPINCRQWYRTDLERRSYTGTAKDTVPERLKTAGETDATSANGAKADEVLGRMTRFLNAQKTVRFTLEYELNGQETMGAVGNGKAFSGFDFRFAKPNLLKVVDDRPKTPNTTGKSVATENTCCVSFLAPRTSSRPPNRCRTC